MGYKKKIVLPIIAVFFSSICAFGQVDTTVVTVDEDFIPVISLSASDFESDDEAFDISGLLQGSNDVFTSTAGYTFGACRFRIRGLRWGKILR